MAITLQESLRGLFYAPFYVALARDAYAAEGVEVRFVSSPRPGDAARNVMDGTVDVCWGGPMRVMQAHQQSAGCDLVGFAEVVTRDPFLLLAREPRPGFVLRDLAGRSNCHGERGADAVDVSPGGSASCRHRARRAITCGGPYDGGQRRGVAAWRGRCGAGVRTVRRRAAARSPRTEPQSNRGALPAHLPRIELVVDVEDKACPCGACPGLDPGAAHCMSSVKTGRRCWTAYLPRCGCG